MLLASELKKALALGVATPQDCPESTANPADEGCNSQLAQYSSTPVLQYSSTPVLHHSITPSLHHSAWPDSRTTTRTRTRTKTKRLGSHRLLGDSLHFWPLYWLFPEDGFQVSNEDRLQFVNGFFLLFRGTGNGGMREILDQVEL